VLSYFCLLRYLELELSRHVLRDNARFCLGAHTLRVETGCWQIHNRLCDKCDLHDVQDKKHILLLCPCLEMCYLRRRFEEQFADCTGRTYNGDTGAFYFDNIGNEDVKMFLLKQTYKSLLFLSETMDILLSDWQCPLDSRTAGSKPSSQPIWLKV